MERRSAMGIHQKLNIFTRGPWSNRTGKLTIEEASPSLLTVSKSSHALPNEVYCSHSTVRQSFNHGPHGIGDKETQTHKHKTGKRNER